MSDTVEIKDRGLKQLLKAFKKLPTIRVGILGSSKNTREETDSTNAQIGAKHEFGLDGMPMRSFLRTPLSTALGAKLGEGGAFEKKAIDRVIREGTLNAYAEKIGVTAEAVVAEAFDSGGFGQWKPSNMGPKKNKQTLVETQQLRNSITSQVVDE